MLLGLLAACGPLALLNAPPSVRIDSPEAGTLVSHSVPVTFVAEVDDDMTPLEELLLLWTLEDGVPLAGETVLDSAAGTVTFTPAAPLPRGEPTITLRAIDGAGESARSSVKLSVFDDLPPTIRWNHPVDGGRYSGGQPIAVSVTIEDPDPLEDTALTLLWEGAAFSTASDVPTSLPASGDVEFDLEALTLASWPIHLTVTDPLGASAESTITFAVVNGDADGDGAVDRGVEGGTDCDDTDGTVFPGATEHCDEVDEDCDGLVDEEAVDATTWFVDADTDGYGDPAAPFDHCGAVPGRVDNDDDCDDTEIGVNPGQTEVCNAVDDDCDGDTDSTAVDRIPVWTDFDEDGYGAGSSRTACVLAAGEAENGDDCDDGDDAVHPGAAEVCDPYDTDEDCNGLVDDDDPAATGFTAVYADSDGDRRGDPATSLTRCDAPSGWVTNADDCDDTEVAAWTGLAETCEDGIDNDCTDGDATCRLAGEVELTTADAALTGDMLAFAGGALAPLGDIDGDGLDDVAIGAWGASEVYLLAGAALASGRLADLPTFTATEADDYLGWSLAGPGDVDGDGLPDLLAAAVDGAGGDGAVYLLPADPAGGTEADAAWSVAGSASARLGAMVAGGADLDGDGDPDVLLGASQAVQLHDGATGTRFGTISGGGGGLGSAVALAPDLDGDGLDDVCLGDDGAEAAYVFYSGALGDLDVSAADSTLTADTAGDGAGGSVAGVGDTDGDGHGDLLVGAPSAALVDTAAGAAYLVTWSAGTGIPSGSLAGATAIFTGEDATDHAGYTVAGPGDVDGDSLDDLLIGAYYDDGGGSAYLVYGASVGSGTLSLSAADVRFRGESAGDAASEGLAGVGDLNGDGFADLGIGATSTGAAAGTAYFILGGAL